MKRSEFLKTIALGGAAVSMSGVEGVNVFAAEGEKSGTPDLVAVLGGEPDVMFQKAIAELGGMERFVKKGQKVVVKPNIGWDRKPETGADTHPALVKEMVKQAFAAGASEVVVFDHTCHDWRKSYANSGIEAAVKEAGGTMLPGNDESYYREVTIEGAKSLKKTKIHSAILDCDVWFNVPCLKHHGGTRMTIAMKNLMGIVWDRQFMHGNGLPQCIADSCAYVKKPALNVVDAYRILFKNGPMGQSEADAKLVKGLFASTDIVAVDAASTKFARQVMDIDVKDVAYIAIGQEMKLGTADLESLNVRQIRV